MDYVALGRSGLQVSRLCLGTMAFGEVAARPWTLQEDDARALVKSALDLGINFFDSADAYNSGLSEQILGRSIRALTQRSETVLATKLWAPTSADPNGRGLSRKHIFEAIDASLKRLGTDYVDLYQIHRWDAATPIEETLDALNDVVRSGRVRYLGASSMYAWQFMKALGLQRQNGWSPFVSMQNHYNLIYREEEREMIPLCLSEGVGVIPWSPLARGFLAKRPHGGPQGSSPRQDSDELLQAFYGSEQDIAIQGRLASVADEAGCSSATMAIAWLASKRGVTSLVAGPRNTEQLHSMASALTFELSSTQIAALEGLYRPRLPVGIDPPSTRAYPLIKN